MRRAIVIPTWTGHFQANLRFLRSYRDRITDPASVSITFIVSNNAEEVALKALLRPDESSQTLHIQVESVRDVLERHAVPRESAQRFSVEAFSNHYSYQSIKKIYGVLESAAEQILVLDSEAFVLKESSIQQLFDNYFSSPFVFVSTTVNEALNKINYASLLVVDPGLSRNELLGSWVFEYPAWFFEKRIARAFVATVEARHGKSLFEVLCSTPNVFEAISYYWFIHEHVASYPEYRFVPIPALLEKYLGAKAAAQFLAHFAGKRHGIMEHFMQGLTYANLPKLQALVKDWKLDFVRFDPVNTPGRIRLYRRLLLRSQHLAVIACSEELDDLLQPAPFWRELWTFIREMARYVVRSLRERIRRFRSSQ